MLGLDENGELAYYYKDEEEGAYISLLENLVNLLQQKDKEIERLKEDYLKEKYLVDKYTRQLTDEYKNTEYQCKEKERLNNIIKRYDKFIRRRLELDGYSDTFIKHQMRELKTPDHNDLLNTKE